MSSTRLYATSVLRTVLFYGTVLAVCLVFPLLVCLAVCLFFLRFYRREIGAFFEGRGRCLEGRRQPDPFQGDGLRFEIVPPGPCFGRKGEAAGEEGR